MRAIDADALLDSIVQENMLWDTEDLFDLMKTQPTIDAAPVIHAHWIESPTAWKCSNCGTEYWSMNHEFKYCPECGAKIEGTEEA